MKKDIYLIRHPQVYNPNKLCYGQSEMPLEENFTVQFDWIKERLKLSSKAIFYSSPLRRCTKLTSYLAEEKFIVDERLTDINFGNWEMKAWAEIPEKETNLWKADFVNYKIKKGERFTDLAERATDFYEEIIDNSADEIVVVTHASVIRSIISYILDFPIEKAFNLQIDYSSISKLDYNKEAEISSITFLNLNVENCHSVN